MTCTITGNVIDLQAQVKAGQALTFGPQVRTVGRSGGSGTIPDPVTVTTDASGDFSVALLPGAYTVKTEGGTRASVPIVVPDAAGANFADIMNLTPPPPLSDAEQAELNAQQYASAAALSEAATAADRVQTGLDRVATGQDATATAADRVVTGQDASATAADLVQTGLDRAATGSDASATAADRVATGQDASATAADRVQTGLDRVATGQDATATAADRVVTGQDASATAADRVQTGLDRAATGSDATATAADRVATGQDASATAADRVQTGLDRVATGGDATATAADRVATGQDATATAADRVQTGLDRVATGEDRTAIEAAVAGIEVQFVRPDRATPVAFLRTGDVATLGATEYDITELFDAHPLGSLFADDQTGAIWPIYDKTAAFTTHTGDTLAVPGDDLGRVEDVRQGRVLGPDQIETPSIAEDEWSSTDPSISVSDGVISLDTSSGSVAAVYQGVIAINGTASVEIVVSNYVSGSLRVRLNTGALVDVSVTGNGTYTVRVPVGSSSFTGVYPSSTVSTTLDITRISVRELPGDHLTQPTVSLRGKLGRVPVTGRRNLLTYTEDFSNAAWTKNGLSVSADPSPTPIEGVPAAKASDDVGFVEQRPAVTSGTSYTTSLYVKSVEATSVVIILTGTSFSGTSATFDLAGGVVSSFTTDAASITPLEGGWYRVSVTEVATATDSTSRIRLYVGGCLLAAPQFETGETATAYQKVVSNLDVSEDGVASVRYWQPSFVDDTMSATLTDAVDGQVMMAGRGGIYIEDVDIAAAGTFAVGPTSWTGGTPGILRAVCGDGEFTNPGLIGGVIREGDFSEAEIARVETFYRARGGNGLLVPGPELVTNGSAFVNTDGWVSARNNTVLSVEAERLRATFTADQVYDGMSFAISGLTVGAAYLLDYDCYNGTTDDGLTFRFKPAATLSGPGDFLPTYGADDLSGNGVLLASASTMHVGLMGNSPVELGDYVEIAHASVRRLIPREKL